MVVGLLVGELDAPGLEIGTFIKIPQFKDIIDQVSIFGVGIPPASMFIKALPLALVCYCLLYTSRQSLTASKITMTVR